MMMSHEEEGFRRGQSEGSRDIGDGMAGGEINVDRCKPGWCWLASMFRMEI